MLQCSFCMLIWLLVRVLVIYACDRAPLTHTSLLLTLCTAHCVTSQSEGGKKGGKAAGSGTTKNDGANDEKSVKQKQVRQLYLHTQLQGRTRLLLTAAASAAAATMTST
jgi:hypothetical protein